MFWSLLSHALLCLLQLIEWHFAPLRPALFTLGASLPKSHHYCLPYMTVVRNCPSYMILTAWIPLDFPLEPVSTWQQCFLYGQNWCCCHYQSWLKILGARNCESPWPKVILFCGVVWGPCTIPLYFLHYTALRTVPACSMRLDCRHKSRDKFKSGTSFRR